MNKSEKQIAQAAERFAKRWAGKGYEKGESQLFWTELLTEVFGIGEPSTVISFEDQVHLDHTSFIDGYIERTHTMIEQKSQSKDLRAPIKQSDGTLLTPFQQAQRYSAALPYSKRPRWIVTCNFETFLVYDMENPDGEPFEIGLADLGKEYYRLRFLVESGNEHLEREMQVSMQAGAIVGRLYDALLKEYKDPSSAESLRSLNVLCVRLVFCLYSEDAGIFGRHDMFHDYLSRYETMDMRNALVRLFKTLDTPIAERDPYLQDDLAAFPYVNGGLFGADIEIPRVNEEIRQLLLQHASLDFDWSEISPTIFGAVFESTLNPETRRSGGMHYTSIENIHKVIDPLFLDDLRSELDNILTEKVANKRRRRLLDYQERLSSLTFLDPACGSGNFLTETYLSLRRLENRLIRSLYEGQAMFIGGEFQNPVRVSIHQFYGIEINDFAKTVATTALWISEAQMLAETERIVARDIDFLPLKTYPNITEGNALRLDWRTLFTTTENSEKSEIRLPDYIMGNPPFIGARMMTAEQKQDLIEVFGAKWKNIGNMDYVCGWYKKAADLMCGTGVKAALVSTNSICQGEQVANLWEPLMGDGIVIDFAHRTFRWDSEASVKAHVHCIIVGFSYNAAADNSPSKTRGGAATAAGALKDAAAPPPPSLRDTSPQAGEENKRGNTDHVMNIPEMKDFRRYLRTHGTSAEASLWKMLKGKQVAGLQFRRQFSVGSHILDFYCPALKLAIELDGDYHYHMGMPDQDYHRDNELLEKYGIRTLRFENKIVFQHPESILYAIMQEVDKQTLGTGSINDAAAPPPPSLRDTSPQAGEENKRGKPKGDRQRQPVIYDGDKVIPARHINAYLIDGPDVFVGSRNKPIGDVPEIGIGNKPIDGGNYLFEKEEMEEFIRLEPKAEPYFRPWYGAVEFIHQKPRYCLWLGDCTPAELRSMPHCLKRVEAVRETRLASKSEGTRKLADRPTRFHVENMPKGNYIIVPSVSSERRPYVPMGFMSPTVFASNLVLIIPDATLYHFGVLESSVHMAWMRAVCGRLEMRYRYSKDVVYNNFPWPEVNSPSSVAARHLPPGGGGVVERIAQTAQAILDARALYPDSSLADLYDPVTMPPELRKAHRENDRAVMAAYGFPTTLTESEVVARLFALYNQLVQQ